MAGPGQRGTGLALRPQLIKYITVASGQEACESQRAACSGQRPHPGRWPSIVSWLPGGLNTHTPHLQAIIYSFNLCWLGICHMPGIVLDAGIYSWSSRTPSLLSENCWSRGQMNRPPQGTVKSEGSMKCLRGSQQGLASEPLSSTWSGTLGSTYRVILQCQVGPFVRLTL